MSRASARPRPLESKQNITEREGSKCTTERTTGDTKSSRRCDDSRGRGFSMLFRRIKFFSSLSTLNQVSQPKKWCVSVTTMGRSTFRVPRLVSPRRDFHRRHLLLTLSNLKINHLGKICCALLSSRTISRKGSSGLCLIRIMS